MTSELSKHQSVYGAELQGCLSAKSNPKHNPLNESTSVVRRKAMAIVRRLWLAAKYVVGPIASLGGIAGLGFVVGGFVWGIAKRITGTMSDPSGWNEWLSILGGGVLILFGFMIALGAIRESLKYLFVLPRRGSHKPT
jgi:hypothetical protein